MPPSKNFHDYSYKTLLLASFLLLFMLCLPESSHAADTPKTPAAPATDSYSVDNVSVDSDGKDTEDARNRAIAQGEEEAFKQLVSRRDPTRANDIAAKATPADINQMVSGFEVLEEKITPNHYHAVLRYNFSPDSIRAMFPEIPQQLPVGADAVPKSKAVLVLPVYREADNTLKLWQDDNKWRSVWSEAALEFGKGLVVTPQGDMNDRVDVDDTNINNATSKSLARMYGRYGIGEVYVLTAFFDKNADPRATLEVTVKKLLQDKDETSRMDYIIRSSETLDALMSRAANDIADHIYRDQTIDPNKVEYDRLKEINARMNVSDIHEWEELRKRILARGNIVGIRMTSISFYETDMVITYKGTPDMLGKTLVASGLRVMQDGDSLVLMMK